MSHEHQSQHQTHHRHTTMKTLVVVTALAAVVLAAPTLHENNYEVYGDSNIANPQVIKRNRKSTQLDSNLELVPIPGTPVVPATTDLETARTFLKKPIIVKKKHGYHRVYRDSDEEQADSRETCVKQVKVKLCDADHTLPKSVKAAQTAGTEGTRMITEEEMKQNIKLAQEAVENLQRDLAKTDYKVGEARFKHDHSETDLELHNDIEVARQALAQVHNNFGNLESMSLHDISVSDMKEAETKQNLPLSVALPEEERLAQWKEAETQQQLPFIMARSEDERLSQWKEALENIDRNVEIARNIEDSFKTASKQILLPEHEGTHTEMRATIDKDEDKTIEMSAPMHKLEKSSEGLLTDLHEDDMTSSAATLSQIKMLNTINDATGFKNTMTGDFEKKISTDAEQLPKEAEMNLLPTHQESQIKTVSAVHEKASEISELREPIPIEALTVEAEHKHPKDVSISELVKDAVDTDIFVKTAEPSKDDEVTVMLTSHPKNTEELQDKTLITPKNAEGMIPPPLMGKTTEWSEVKSAEPSKHFHENIMDHRGHHHEIVPHHHEMMPHHHVNGPHHHDMHHHMNLDHHKMRWSQDDMNMQMAPMRASESVQLPVEHHHHLTEHALRNNIDTKHMSLQLPQQQRFPETMMQGKSADMENTFFMNMRDVNNLPMDNQRLRWKPTHETSRSAYGPAPGPIVPSSPSGAVGVFPNANVGPCGIPLLLSCNPSVVSGSLAKPHSYSSPAYRTEDDFNFHNKRDVKKTDILTNTLNRTPTHLNPKTSILVAKQ